MTTTICRLCGLEKPDSGFAPHALILRRCRDCCKAQLDARRGNDGDIIKRLLFSLKNRGRDRGIKELALWRYEDVKKLYDDFVMPPEIQAGIEAGMQPRLRVMRIDESSPFIPSNAEIRMFGEGTRKSHT